MRLLTSLLCLLLAATAAAGQDQGNKTQELPAAPSASRMPAPAPKPPVQQPVQPPPSNPKPATPPEPRDIVPAAPPVAASTGAAKPAPGAGDDTITTIRVPVNEVNVIFTVTDKRGRFVKDLKPEDIQVLDDRRPPQQIVSFRAETDLPLRVGLLVDASNSIRDRFRFEQEAAIEFLSQIVRPKRDQGFVLGFDTTAEVTQDFSDNAEKLTNGVRSLRPGGGTAMFDAIYFACRDKLMKINRARSGAARHRAGQRRRR